GDADDADDLVVLSEFDALDAGRAAPHQADILLVEADGHAAGGGEEEVIAAGGQGHIEEFIAFLKADGDEAGLVDVAVVLKRGAFHDAVAADEGEEVAAFLEVLDIQERSHALGAPGPGDVAGAAFGLGGLRRRWG